MVCQVTCYIIVILYSDTLRSLTNKMPKGKPQHCECGCGVTPTNYRKKFFETWSTGYPYEDSERYYCSNYGRKDKNGDICSFVVSEKCAMAHVDHIWPKAQGGDDCINNLRIMCSHCNTSKNDDITGTAKACKGKKKNNVANLLKRKINV